MMMILRRCTKVKNLGLVRMVTQSRSAQIREARSVREELPMEPIEKESDYDEAYEKTDQPMGFYKTGLGFKEDDVQKNVCYARAFNTDKSSLLIEAASLMRALYFKRSYLFSSTRGFTKYHNPSTLERKATIAKAVLERTEAAAQVPLNEDTFPVLDIRCRLIDFLSRERCEVNMARQLHALTLTSGILHVPGAASLEIRKSFPKLYQLCSEGKPKNTLSMPTIEEHFMSTDPTKY